MKVPFFAIPLTLAAGLWAQFPTLESRISALSTRPSKNDLGQLVSLHMLAGDYSNAAKQARNLFILEPGWGPLFDEGLARTALKDAQVMTTWRDFYGLKESDRPGPRWAGRADMLRDTFLAGKILDEDKFIAWIRELWYAKGYSLTKSAIDVYEKYGGVKDLQFLRELRGEALVKAGCPGEALKYWKRLYTATGDEYYLYQQGRIFFKRDQFTETWGVLKGMKEPGLKTFNYYYMIARSAQALNFEDDLKEALTAAKSLAKTERETNLLMGLSTPVAGKG